MKTCSPGSGMRSRKVKPVPDAGSYSPSELTASPLRSQTWRPPPAAASIISLGRLSAVMLMSSDQVRVAIWPSGMVSVTRWTSWAWLRWA